MPVVIREEEVMWRSVLGLSVVPGAMVLIASWRLVPESPRFLSFVAEHDEGVKVRSGTKTLLNARLNSAFALDV